MLIDTHSHLYVKDFESDIAAVMQRADDAGVKRIYLPAIDSNETGNMLKLEADYPGRCFAMMGLHPCSVQADYKNELQMVKDWLGKRKFAAIGEIGLDFYWDKTFTEQQYEAFRMQIELSLQYKLPIVIHTRNAMQETIKVVSEFLPMGVRGIFHCFGGSYADAKQITDMGFYLGIGGVLTYKKSGLAEVLATVELEYLVLETDSPYLTPVPFRGKRNESSYIKYVVEKLAEIKKTTVDEVAAITSNNAQKIFGL